jgi:ribosomal protein L30/L7E
VKKLKSIKSMKKLTTLFIILPLILTSFTNISAAASIAEKVKGKIVLQVESHGEAYYVYPDNLKRYYLGRPGNAFDIMRALGLGITNANLAKIPKNTDNWVGETSSINRVKGKILLQVESHGEAWYVFPNNGKRYYLGRPSDAFEIMRSLGLGITTKDLLTITLGTITGNTGGTNGGDTSGNADDNNGDASTEDPNSVTVSTTSALVNAIEDANNGGKKTILVENGTYTISNMLWVSANGVTVRSKSGNREAVILQGDSMTGSVSHIFNVV